MCVCVRAAPSLSGNLPCSARNEPPLFWIAGHLIHAENGLISYYIDMEQKAASQRRRGESDPSAKGQSNRSRVMLLPRYYAAEAIDFHLENDIATLINM